MYARLTILALASVTLFPAFGTGEESCLTASRRLLIPSALDASSIFDNCDVGTVTYAKECKVITIGTRQSQI